MEFREYYRGICAKIRYDSHTGTYTGELDGFPVESFVRSNSYKDLQTLLKQAVDEYHAGRKTNLGKEWPSAVKLPQAGITKEAEELEEAMARIAAEMFKTTD